MTSEDEIIRRRLLYDGNGTGDERRIHILLKTIAKWSTSDLPEDEGSYKRIVATLNHCNYAMQKNHLSYEMNIKEKENYEKLYEEIGQNILEAKKEIENCKELLHEARKKRKNRHEYDALAKVIDKHPDRIETQREIGSLDTELQQHKKVQEEVAKKLEKRKKQFHVLIHSLQVLQQILNENGKDIDDKRPDSDQMDTS